VVREHGSSFKKFKTKSRRGRSIRLLSGCRQQPTGDWACASFNPPQLTDRCVKRAAAAHYCGSQPLFQVRNLASPRAGRPVLGCSVHTQGGRHQGTWVKSHIDPGCCVPCLVWCILWRVGAPAPFHRLREHCGHFAAAGFSERARGSRQQWIRMTPHPDPKRRPLCLPFCCLCPLRAAPSLSA